jgi:hypothetical protein
VNPKFPIYIPSKSRWDSKLTMICLDTLKVPYKVIVEEEQFKQYADSIGEDKLLILPKKYQDEYQTFDDFGDKLGKGSGPARNFAWEHSISEGHEWHWIIDDNIREFYRLNRNRKIRVGDGTIFKCAEDFVLRYKNIGMAGFHYETFVHRKTKKKPYIINSRIYSCNLIRNDLPYRWRLRFNEDTDLSLRMLKGDWCTVLFCAFLQKKTATQRMKGGNTSELYSKVGTFPKSVILAKMHPDVCKVVWRWGRYHHYIDYKKHFRQKLIFKDDIELKNEINNYGMKLIKIDRANKINTIKRGKHANN